MLRSARSSGSTRSAIRRMSGRCRTRNGEDDTTAMPSSAASCSSRIRLSVARASASSSRPRSATPSTITSPAARSSAEIFRTTIAACSRGRRSAAAGTTVAATSATQPPTTASLQRTRASDGAGTSAEMMIDCTAAWVTNIWPLVISSADVIASATTSVSCHQPEPIRIASRSASSTPSATPVVTSATRRSRWP